MSKESTKEIVKLTATFTDEIIGQIHTWDELGEYISQQDIMLEHINSYGSGLTVLDNKDRLVDVPFMILDYRFHDGKQGEFVSVAIMTKLPILVNGEAQSKLVLNDGSTGIKDQLKRIENDRINKGNDVRRPIYCPKGLRKSEYEIEIDGELTEATTYYIAM